MGDCGWWKGKRVQRREQIQDRDELERLTRERTRGNNKHQRTDRRVRAPQSLDRHQTPSATQFPPPSPQGCCTNHPRALSDGI